MNNLDMIKKMNETKSYFKGVFKKQKDIFYKFEDGENIVRLVGLFKKVRTHFIAPTTKRQGLCKSEAFSGDNSLPYVVNCPDWDIENDCEMPERTCPICKINRIVRKEIKEKAGKIKPERKEYLEKIQRDTNATTGFKWNAIDRRDPYITEVDEEGKEKKIKGYKVITVGSEAWKQLEVIFTQLKIDLADNDGGIDINISKGHNGARTAYTVQPVMEGLSVKATPLSEEEKAMKLHDLKRITGKVIQAERILKALHDEYREIFESVNGEVVVPKKTSPKPVEEEKVPPFEIKENEDDTKYEGEIECFGSADEKHSECIKCSSLEDCVIERDSKKM